MHESALVRKLIAQVERVRTEHAGAVITSVTVEIGALTGMSQAHLRETFEALKSGTALEQSHLYVDVAVELDNENAQAVLLKSVEMAVQE